MSKSITQDKTVCLLSKLNTKQHIEYDLTDAEKNSPERNAGTSVDRLNNDDLA